MGKKIPESLLDQMLDVCEGTRIHVCTDEPANYAAIAGLELAAANISGSYSKSGSGFRQNTCPAQSAIPITATGEADHIVVSDGSAEVMVVTTCPAQMLTSGGTVDLAAWTHALSAAV